MFTPCQFSKWFFNCINVIFWWITFRIISWFLGHRRTGTATMMDDYDYGNGNDGQGNATLVGGNHRQWPASSADIVEYDSSAVADSPTPQQQQQYLLPHNQPQQHNQHLQQQNPGAPVSAYDSNSAAGRRATQVDHNVSTARKSTAKWKTRALYVFLACLLAVVVVNLTLTLWFIRVTQFTSVIIKCLISYNYFHTYRCA